MRRKFNHWNGLTTNTDDRMSRQRCKIVTITILHMSEKLVRNTKKTQIKIKTTMYEMTNTLNGINGKLHIGELEYIIIETIQNEIQRKKEQKWRASVSHGTTSGGLI